MAYAEYERWLLKGRASRLQLLQLATRDLAQSHAAGILPHPRSYLNTWNVTYSNSD
jgi:hypothetical protein